MEDLQAMIDGDAFASLLGARLVEATDDHVEVALDITADHLNFLAGGHGAVLFAVADIALSLISNRQQTAVAVDTHLVLLSGFSVNDTLIATARPVKEGRTMATYRVDVVNGLGRPVGAFTGTVHISDR